MLFFACIGIVAICTPALSHPTRTDIDGSSYGLSEGESSERNLDAIGGGHLLRSPGTLRLADMFPRDMRSRNSLDSLSGGGFGSSKRLDTLSGIGFGTQKRNFDEIDRSGFNSFIKRNFDEIDRSGFNSFVKKNFDEIDRSNLNSFVKRNAPTLQ